ncbi:DNA-binding XRE family transcriptional regulator [Nonlabens dokdonensis]|jgi:transcriptional regulator with XRE-family HTH domain|uniref:Adenine-specific DNA methyltransferase n=2 Tax=Nonlabens dokdonensis TaxID=328515 RepID=L7WAG3_NONDD|nr:helix-turn-helix transcriptional regulator [Nonlabens dokdonensis]AGC77134.1 adenine-specific DNA methyltransferase [Nonlabens dokdonensis DSW-6]PZX41093.1 DNA-binding XRE family transcriptional regulator [Nonlabens dokdonensis]
MSTQDQEPIEISQSQRIAFQKAFGKRLAELRKASGLSQLDLASLINVEKTSISRIENGRVNFTFYTATRLALALNVELSSLFSFSLK